MHRGRGARWNPHVALLFAQLLTRLLQLEYKPPVTIALLAVNVLLFFADLRQLLPRTVLTRLLDGALQPRLIIERREWWRLVSSGFLHLDEWHLYYNMSSLVWKGVQLERQYGSVLFAALVSELLLLSHGLYVILTVLMSSYIPDYRYLYRDLRVAGFSAVLFGLKTVLSHNSPDYSDIMGIRMPTKYVCWAELFLASFMTPHVSFLGHLCGILAGLMHVRLIEPAARDARGQLRRCYVRCVNALRRRPMPRNGGRRLGGGGERQPQASGSGAAAGRTTAEAPRTAARAGPVLGGGGGGGTGAGGSGRDGGYGGGGGGTARGGGAAAAWTQSAADYSSDADSDGGDGAAGRTAGASTSTTLEETRRKRLERLERASQAAKNRYGSGTARRTTGSGPQQPAGATAGDSSQAAAAANRRYFNCGGTLGGGVGGGGGGGGSGPVGEVPGSEAAEDPGGGMGRSAAAGAVVAAAGDRTAGTAGLTDEELRRRRLEWLDRAPRR